MNFELGLRIVSIATVSVIVLLGLMLLTGLGLPPAVPDTLRYVMGPVMLVYGGYRAWTFLRRRPEGNDTDEDDQP